MLKKNTNIKKEENPDYLDEQIRLLYDGIPVAVIVNLSIAFILSVIQFEVRQFIMIGIWLACMLPVQMIRIYYFLIYKRLRAPYGDGMLLRFRMGAGLTGIVWGLSGFLLFPPDNIAYQAMLSFALAGMTAGAITSLSIDTVSLRLFSVPALSVLTARLFFEAENIAVAMGAMTSLFIFFTYVIGKRTNRYLMENIILRIEKTRNEKFLKAGERQLKQAQKVSHTGSYEWNLVTGEQQWSEENYRLFGLEPHSVKPDYELFKKAIHPDDLERVEKELNEAVGGGKFYDCMHRIIRPDGSERYIHGRGEVVFDDTGKAVRMDGTVQDVTEQKSAEVEMRIAAIAFNTQEAIVITDANGVLIKCNNAFSKITGYSPDEAIGRTPSQLVKSGRHDREFYKTMWEHLIRDKFWQGEIWNRRKSGEIFPEWLSITAVTDKTGSITHYVASFKDISEQKKNEELIHSLAFYDPLTELPNRRLLVDRLKQSIASTTRNKRQGAILFIDLDNFKKLNDTRGHGIGDLLLIDVASRLKHAVRSVDTVARLGGDEFVVILNDLSAENEVAALQAENIAEKIRDSISRPYELQGDIYHSTPSIGISFFNHAEIDIDELFRRADTAMYQAKHSGRNSVRFFDPDTHLAMENRIKLEGDLRQAISRNHLKSYYQIQVDSECNMLGAEVLLRWIHPVRGMILPGQFIPLAEESGLILSIGNWVLESACRQLKIWESDEAAKNFYLTVNVSAHQFHQREFAQQVIAMVEKYRIDPGKLKLELTESAVLNNIHESITTMDELKEFGISFSMDDFGTGYSSLSYLSQLPLDQVKIDQSFVRTLGSNKSNNVIVQTIIAMTKTLKLDVIAEGVETKEQKNFLEESGCMKYQGYYFGKPLPLEELEKNIKEISTF